MKKSTLLSCLIISGFFFTHDLLQAQSNREWTVVASYTIPGKASGLAWDGTYLYSGLYSAPGDDNLIYRIDPANGSYTLQCAGPFEAAYGLTFDGTDLWTTDHPSSNYPADAIRFSLSGDLVSTFELPATYMSGIEYDNGFFWACCYYNPDGMTYKLTSTGEIITQFPTPNLQPWDICRENDYLWVVDYNAYMIYRTDTLGNVIEEHASVGQRPAGITFDGQYLWYIDGPLQAQSTLYKIDLGGAGTPVIHVPETSHDYGVVTVGGSSVWNMAINNTGTADLVVNSLIIPGAVPIFTSYPLPESIPPGGSISIPLAYEPTEPGPLQTQISIESSDPVTPSVPVTLTGQAVLNGPNLVVDIGSHNYGNVRINAYTRWFLEVANNGNETLVISGIDFDDDHFSLDEGTMLPLNIGALQSARIGIWFHPVDDVSYSGTMEITHNGIGQNPYPVLLSGSGLDKAYPIGDLLWYYNIDVSWDNSPKAIAPIHDISGDNISDVIVCSEDDYVRCFNGNSHNIADVLWEVFVYSGAVYSQSGLIVVDDIDSDGYQDVIIGTAWGDRSVIALSGKTGQQIWKFDTHAYGGGGWVYQVDAGQDYNGDGVKDVLAATGDDASDTGPKRIFCLNGLTGALIWDCFTGGPNFAVIGVEDFTGDNIPDVIAGASNEAETQGRVYGISGSNGAIVWTQTTTGSSAWALAALKDINGDDIPDVASGDFSGNITWHNAVNGGVLNTNAVFSAIILHFVVAADVNADSHPDILVGHSGSNAVMLSGLDASTLWTHSLPDKPWNVAVSNDLSGDGIGDVMLGTLFSNNYCYFLDGVNGSELKSNQFSSAIDAINAIPDITGDNSFEMVAGGRNGAVHCYSGGINSVVGVPESPLNLAPAFHSTCWPNPFREQVTIGFYLPEPNYVVVEIYTVGGILVETLLAAELSSGDHQVLWDSKGYGSGIYLYRITAGGAHSTGVMLHSEGI